MKERPILEGRKTQTRRMVKAGETHCNLAPAKVAWPKCPYGKAGDRLWVKETFRENEPPSGFIYRASEVEISYTYKTSWKPSIFMPRRASRITLEVAAVRVERLQEISDEDAIAEGIEWGVWDEKLGVEGWRMYLGVGTTNAPRLSYRTLWESINGAGSWDANPWVWVITFRRSSD